MNSTQLDKLETCLNNIPMDDEFFGKRTARDVASLFYQRNNVTVCEVNSVEAALDQLAMDKQIDRIIDNGKYLYSSAKFGSMREQYMGMLQRAAEEIDEIQTCRRALISSWNRSPQDFFTVDSHWYHEVN